MPYVAPAARPAGAGERPVPLTQFLADSVGVTTAVTAPGAGATIATITPAVVGRYSIQVNAGLGLGGTPAAADNANMQLTIAGTAIATLPIVAAANVIVGCGTFIMTLQSGQAVAVIAVGAATVSTVYIAQIICTLMGRLTN